MERQLGQFDLWTIESDTVIVRESDKSFFDNRELEIPSTVRWFFGVDELKQGEKLDITLKYNNVDYHCSISCDTNTDRIRIFLDSLSKIIDEYSPTDGKYPNVIFEKRGSESYLFKMEKIGLSKKLSHQEFWQMFNNQFDTNAEFVAKFNNNKRKAWEKSYYDLEWGERKVQHIVVRHLVNEGKLKAELYFDNNVPLYEKLETFSKEIQDRFIEKVTFTPARVKENPKARIIYIEKQFKLEGDDNYWKRQIDWLQNSSIKLKNVLDEFRAKEQNIADKKSNVTEIDYLSVLDYLENNQEVTYSNPETEGLGQSEKQRFLEIRGKGEDAVAEMQKMADVFSGEFKLDKCLPISWLDGSGTKTRKYLCTQLKYSKFEDNPTSVSIFVEKNGENAARFRISLEIENDGLDKATMDKYHSHLDVPLNKEAGLVYVSGSNKWGNPIVMDKPQDEIKKDVTECKIRKVQVSRYVERKPDETNEYYHMEISKAISAIIPYYDYVLEIETREEALEVMFDKNMILYGPPGTGKTYNTAIYAVAICDGKSIDELTNYKEVMARYNELKSKNRITFITFHQSYGYEEFIEGIKPIVDKKNNEIGYTIESGIFKEFCDNVRKSEEIDEVPYVFIIDEINRGNISKIFGELITLIEDTKREGMPEAVSAILPYSGKTFSIPSNVYILGTLNTADRSIALMDTALRRRFQFVEMMPNSDVIRKIHADKVIVGNDVLDVAAMLDTINERITFLYDREHTIGHSFFIGLATNPSIDNLAGIFSKSIIPLLQEYFYEDYQKIQLVLGDNSKTEESHKFIRDTKVVAKNIFKGSMDDIVDLPEKKYEINYEAFTNILSYIEIM